MIRGAPSGFAVEGESGRLLLARTEHLPALVRAGLLDPRAWDAGGDPGRAAGRGATRTIRIGDGLVLRVKQMRRGGLLRRAWRDRFLGTGRLVRNLTGPVAALERGVPTVEPIALLVERGALGTSRGWLATREASDATSLSERLRSDAPPDSRELAAVVDSIRRMHDAGIDHRDLNLGNVLLPGESDARPPLVIDLDRARVLATPVPAASRLRALGRLERSTVKLLGNAPFCRGIDLRRFWYEEYARGAPTLARRVDRARRVNRWAIALHRLGWRR